MKLRQLAAELRAARDDLKAARKALEERHCPPDCKCRWTATYYPTTTTSVASGAYTPNTILPTFTISGGNWSGT